VTATGFLIPHGSALILPMSVIEGPIVSVATGLLSSNGYFVWHWALFLLVCGDLIGDVIYYGIGRLGRGVGRGLSPGLRAALAHNAGRILLIGKWTHSLGCVVLIGSGMVRVPLARFLLVNLIATTPKSALLFSIGYFIGNHFPLLERHSLLVTVTLGIGGLVSMGWVLLHAGKVRAHHPKPATVADGPPSTSSNSWHGENTSSPRPRHYSIWPRQ
jgi:membrane-associated protein